MGPAVSDSNKWLILLSVIRLNGGHCILRSVQNTRDVINEQNDSVTLSTISTSLVSRITRKLSLCFALTRIENSEKSESITNDERRKNVGAFKERVVFESHLTSGVNPIKDIFVLKKTLLVLYSRAILYVNLDHNNSIDQWFPTFFLLTYPLTDKQKFAYPLLSS